MDNKNNLVSNQFAEWGILLYDWGFKGIGADKRPALCSGRER